MASTIVDKSAAQSDIDKAVASFLSAGGRISRLAEKDPRQAQADFYEARRNRLVKQAQRHKRRG
jgi:hypothetical protein